MTKFVTIINIAFVFISMACQSPMGKTLRMAGNNKDELKKALEYFKKDGCPEKMEAVRFLIQHMPGHYAFDTTNLEVYRPFLVEAEMIISKYDLGVEQNEALNKAWKIYKERVQPRVSRGELEADCRHITSEFVIRNVNQAYQAWTKNPFYQDGSFYNFLEHVLPYRRANGLPLEDWRSHFASKNPGILNKYDDLTLLQACDTLLAKLSDLMHNNFIMGDYPLMKIEDFERLKRGLCDHKCWYNSMFFASLGIPCAIDFVPAWGNRNAAHSWNVILHADKSFAFEPFWDTDRWKYKRIYNNISWDDKWGKFRLPKVYRHTYSSHPIGPIVDTRVNPLDIPVLFRNVKKKDVSHEYFETSDISVQLTQTIPPDTYYCYLCVFGYQEWHPVQWGKIIDGNGTFKAMGRDIVYLPCYYKNGVLSYAANPFLLKSCGSIQELEGGQKKAVILNRVTPEIPRFREGIEGVAGGKLEIMDSTMNITKTFLVIPDTMLIAKNMFYLDPPIMGQAIRFVFPREHVSIGDMGFYSRDAGGRLKKLEGELIAHEVINVDMVKKAMDGIAATALNISKDNVKKKTDDETLWIGVNFGKQVKIDAVSICPRISSNLWITQQFELFYWHNGWNSAGVKDGNNHFLQFNDIPSNTLLLLKNKNWRTHSGERLFIYEDGEQKWY